MHSTPLGEHRGASRNLVLDAILEQLVIAFRRYHLRIVCVFFGYQVT